MRILFCRRVNDISISGGGLCCGSLVTWRMEDWINDCGDSPITRKFCR
jgi:hypothetical protein